MFTSSKTPRRVLQLLPPYIHCTGATLARMQILKCWESKRGSEEKGFHTDPCGPMLLNQVGSKPTSCYPASGQPC